MESDETPEEKTPVAKKESRRVDLIISVIGLVLGLFGLFIGVYHVHELGKMRSTRYLGTFPDFLDDIITVVDHSRRNLTVACDFPGYADFTDPDKSVDYLQRIRQRKKDAKVELICMDAATRQKYLDQQFPKAEWEAWEKDATRGTDEKTRKIERFLASYGRKTTRVDTREQLFRVMNDVDEEVLRVTFLGDFIAASNEFPIYFWIADCKEAVFSIATPSQNGVEHGFYTKDPSLIKALLDLRGRYVTQPAKLSKPCP